MPTRRRKNVRVVYQSLAEHDLKALPGGYIELADAPSHPVHMRKALEAIRDHDMRFRLKTLRQTVKPAPILATMQFQPWTCFAVARRLEDAHDPWLAWPKTRHGGPKRQALGSAWYEYFCFQRVEDLVMFRMVWG